MYSNLWAKSFRLVYNEGTDDGTQVNNDDGTNLDDLPPSAKGKTSFTQDEFNKALAEDRRKHKEQLEKQKKETEKQIKMLEKLQQAKGLNDKEKQELSHRLEELQNSMLTKEQLASKEREKLSKQYEEQVKQLTADRDTWQSRYVSSTINTSIIGEATRADAFDPDALISILGPNTRLAEETDEEGNKLGTFTPKVKFTDTDKDGKPVTLDLTVEQAVKRMKEMPRYGYLFKSTATGGLGGNPPVGKGGKQDLTALAKDPAKYREWRKKEGMGRKNN